MAMVIAGVSLNAQHLGSEYRLKKVIPVAGRQGIAIDSNYYYVSDTRALYKYDKSGKLIAKNDQPFQNPSVANHFGDIDIHNGEIYCGIEKFEYGRGYNIAVSIYDAKTLKWKRDLPWSPESGQVEVSGLAVDRDKNMVWMSDWVDSRYVYAYDLETGKYYTKMQCLPTPYWCQGIFIADGKMLFTSDDGEALYQIPDNIYVADITEVPYTGLVDGKEVVKDTPFSVKLDSNGKPVMREGKVAGGAKKGRVELFREMSDFKRAGEIEGLSIDPVNDDLVVLNNRGTQIVLGMSQGPFTDEGYTGEIHELYIYEKVK
jgi:outer membrane protein assembly factor BamB